jgi:hypothetical protein
MATLIKSKEKYLPAFTFQFPYKKIYIVLTDSA